MGWNPDVLVALIKTNSQRNIERVLNRKGADARMQERTANALKFIKKKELLKNESEADNDSGASSK